MPFDVSPPRSLTAIFREPADDGAARAAYEDLRDWALDEFKPHAGKMIRRKVRDLAAIHGVKEGAILRFLMTPPGREPHKKVVDFLYEAVFAR